MNYVYINIKYLTFLVWSYLSALVYKKKTRIIKLHCNHTLLPHTNNILVIFVVNEEMHDLIKMVLKSVWQLFTFFIAVDSSFSFCDSLQQGDLDRKIIRKNGK